MKARDFCLLLLLLCSPVLMGMAPMELGSLELGRHGVSIIRVTPDGKHVAMVQGGGILLINTESVENPHIEGRIPLKDSRVHMALSPDGKLLLLCTTVSVTKNLKIMAYDVSKADNPELLWEKDYASRYIAISPDASAYAVHNENKDENDWAKKFSISIFWIDEKHTSISVPSGYIAFGNILISAGCSFLALQEHDTLEMIDLRSEIATYGIKNGLVQRSAPGWPILLLDSGELLVSDKVAPRILVYENAEGIPRIGALGLEDSGWRGWPGPHLLKASRDSTVVIADSARRLYRYDLTNPANPRQTGTWQLPGDSWSCDLDERGRIFVARNERGRNASLSIYDLNAKTQDVIDWKALELAHRESLEILQNSTKSGDGRYYDAINRFELALPMEHLEYEPTGVYRKDAAFILYDYAFILEKLFSKRRDDQ